jgi:Terpene synthase family 2, C-terminal metal binding
MFDWQEIVAENKPGQTSEVSRARLLSLMPIIEQVSEWGGKLSLNLERAKISGYTGVITTPIPTPPDLAFLISAYTLWIFNLDDHIDRLEYAKYGFTTPKEQLNFFDNQLNFIVKPLYANGLTITAGVSCGLNPTQDLTQIEPVSQNLSLALADLLAKISSIWQETAFSLPNFVLETAKMLGAMRTEFAQNLACQQELNQLPSIEGYLENSKYSIAMASVGATACGFESNPQFIWQSILPAMLTGAKIIRLSNDLGNLQAELEEQKVNSVVIALHGLPQDGRDIEQAKKIVIRKRAEELSLFAAQLKGLPESFLLVYLKNMVAFGIAMYEQGNYVAP